MSLNAVNISKGRIGANRLGSNDSVSAMVFMYLDELVGFETGIVYVAYTMSDVEALGITQAYDDENLTIAHRHCKEFFRNAGEGTKLFLYNSDETLEGSLDQAKNLLNEAKGEIRQIAFINAKREDSAPEVVLLDGIPTEVHNAIPLAQGLYNWAFANFMPLQILLECYTIADSANTVLDLRAIPDLQADKVSLVIGQDHTYAASLPVSLRKFADVGTALGVLSKAKVHENIGDNEQYNLTDATRGAWLEPGLSNHATNTELAEQLETLDAKGYIFGVNYIGLAGARFNNDHVCTPIILDDDNNINEHTIAYGRVADKAVRELRTAYLPKAKTTWNVDSATGKLTSGTIVALEDIGDNVFQDMFARGEISFGKTKINPESDLLVEKILRVSYVIVPKGTINEIRGTINLKTRDNG